MNILAVGPHPGEIEFGCAAVLIKEATRRNRVKILVLSRGEAGSSGTPELREQEARAAAKLIGADISFLDFGGDCHLEYRRENVIAIATEVRRERPDVVLGPHPRENQHPDHVAIGRMLRDACRLARYGGLTELLSFRAHKIGALLFYNITAHVSPVPDIVVDVSDFVHEWEAVMHCHQTQVGSKQYMELQMAAARTLGLAAGFDLAVGLYANDPICVNDLSVIAHSARAF